MPDFLNGVISAVAGLFGVGMGGAIALFNQRKQRADERIQKQGRLGPIMQNVDPHLDGPDGQKSLNSDQF
jgi:hypothetical protein